MMFGGPTKPGKLSLFGVWRKVTLGKLLESNPGVPLPELMMMAHDPAAWEVLYGARREHQLAALEPPLALSLES